MHQRIPTLGCCLPPWPLAIQLLLTVSLQAPTTPYIPTTRFTGAQQGGRICQMEWSGAAMASSAVWQSIPLWAALQKVPPGQWGARRQPGAGTALWPLVLLCLLCHAFHDGKSTQARVWAVCHPPLLRSPHTYLWTLLSSLPCAGKSPRWVLHWGKWFLLSVYFLSHLPAYGVLDCCSTYTFLVLSPCLGQMSLFCTFNSW